MLDDGDLIEFGRFRLHRRGRTLLADGVKLDLGARAIDVLLALIDAGGRMLSKEILLHRVWPDAAVEENNLYVQIVALRRALGPDRDLIRTVPRHGYRFMGHVTVGARPAPAAPVDTVPSVSPARSAPPVPVEAGPTVSPASNLPIPVGDLIGREADLRQVVELLTTYRLVTLAGPGGIGKTSLAFAAAWHLVDHFPDGVRLADLATLADPNLTLTTIATALDLQQLPSPLLAEHVATRLESRKLLLVLDNCEHLIEPVARIAETLLHGAPQVQILATSRELLRAEGECVYRVPALAVPGNGVTDTDAILRHSAVRLFVMRARLGGARPQLDHGGARTISGICRRLDGIPLAIELAAARAVVLGVQGVAAGLDDRFRALTGGRRTALPRHQTLRATLDWSFGLLPEAERAVLRGLAIFAGGFDQEAAKAILATTDGEALDVVDSLTSLFAKSLVTRDIDSVPVRYRLLDSTRAYAAEKLVESGAHEPLARRHAEYYRDLFAPAEAETELRPQAEWLATYGRHIDDVRASLNWAFSPNGDRQIGVALTIAAVPLWVQLSLLGECHERVERALQALDDSDPMILRRRMQLSAALGWSLMYGVGRAREAGPAWATTLQLADSLDDKDYRLRALWGLCIDQFNNGEFRAALGYARRFADLVENSTDAIELIMGDRILATALHYIGDQRSARHHIDLALTRLDEIWQQYQIVRLRFDMRVSAHYFQARILWLQGFADQALRAVEHNIEEGLAIGHALTFCSVLGQAACPISFLAGDLDTAARYGAMLVQHTERHPIRLWHLWARCFNGLVAVKRADAGGLEVLRRGLEDAGEARFLPRFLLLHGELAACLGEAGDSEQGLVIVEETLARCEARDEGWYLPELLRIRGRLLLLQGPTGAAGAAEDSFRQALDLARRQGALSWELRAATSLARMRCGQGRCREARELLVSVYGQFTEGFATADLGAAKTLIDELPQT